MKNMVVRLVKTVLFAALLLMSCLYVIKVYESHGQSNKDEIVGNSKTDIVVENSFFNTSDYTEGRIYLGKENAENEVIFVLDYSCPYCKQWIEEIFPLLEKEYIKNGEVKFFSLPQVYLSKKTLALTEFTQKVEKLYPVQYFDLLSRIYNDHELEEWGTDYYINLVTEDLKLYGWEEVGLDYDVIRRTRQVTRGLEVDVVPTIYINGYKVQDSMDYNEISQLLSETRKPGWATPAKVCEKGSDGDC